MQNVTIRGERHKIKRELYSTTIELHWILDLQKIESLDATR